jgi:hypothetical protein
LKKILRKKRILSTFDIKKNCEEKKSRYAAAAEKKLLLKHATSPLLQLYKLK